MPIPLNSLKNLKEKYDLNVYFETGLSRGRGVDSAISAGFDRIYSIEICTRWITEGREKYNADTVTLIQGDSQDLFAHIKGIDEPILFFLDAHNDHSNLDGEQSSIDCPIHEELDAIKKHHINNHIIVVDDINIIGSKSGPITAQGGEFKGRDCVNWGKDMRLSEIKNRISKINSYNFAITDNQLIASL